MTKYPADATVCEADRTPLVPDETFAHVDRDPQPGDKIGEYVVEGKLGEGGFGAVYRAVHPVIGKPAAIKILSRQFSANPQMVSRFIAEARAVNQIRHRNIIDVFSFGQTADGRQYYVMELLDGLPFDRYLAEHKRLTLEQAMPILRGVARAMDAAHAKGILHRDLKPENIYLVFDEDGGVSAKLLDFGLAKLVGVESGQHKTKTGTPMGTPYYMSPEQCRGLEVDARTDVYAFGVIVFEVLTGRVPYEGTSPMDVLLKHMSAEPPSASSVPSGDVPPALDAPIKRMLAKEPGARPPTLGKALEDLATAANVAVGGSSAQGVPPPFAQAPRTAANEATTMSGPTLAHVPGSETPPVKVVTGGAAATSGAPAPATGQTFLGAEADVAHPRRSRVGIGVIVAAACVIAGVVGWVTLVNPAAKPKARHALVQPTTPATSAPLPASTVATPPTADQRPSADKVSIRVEGAPRGAHVKLGDELVGEAPGPFEAPAGKELHITVLAKGWKPEHVTITPTGDTEVPVKMERAPVQGTGGTTVKTSPTYSRDLEKPDFTK